MIKEEILENMEGSYTNGVFFVKGVGMQKLFFFPRGVKYGKRRSKFYAYRDSRTPMISEQCVNAFVDWKQEVDLRGLGLKAFLEEETKTLRLRLGLSHLVEPEIPKNISIRLRTFRLLQIRGGRSAVSQFAATVRKCMPPNPYKERGIYYRSERPQLKEGKKT